jgi:hypothetical protein
MRQKFWKWLLRLAYRNLRHNQTHLPDGVPGKRSKDAECTGYSPRKLKMGESAQCEGDGHYLCGECCFKMQ